jgi:hypothetical protein
MKNNLAWSSSLLVGCSTSRARRSALTQPHPPGELQVSTGARRHLLCTSPTDSTLVLEAHRAGVGTHCSAADAAAGSGTDSAAGSGTDSAAGQPAPQQELDRFCKTARHLLTVSGRTVSIVKATRAADKGPCDRPFVGLQSYNIRKKNFNITTIIKSDGE